METADGLMIVSSETPEVETPPPGDAETPTGVPAPPEPGQADSPPAPEADEPDDGAVSPRELKRLVGRMTAQRAAMERELSATRAQVETLTRLIQPAAPPPEITQEPQGPPRRPRMGDYASEEDYQAAEERYITDMVDWRAAEREAQARMQERGQSQAREYEQTMQAIRSREQDILRTVPDYYERFERIGPTLSPDVLTALKLSGARGPDLVVHLAAHPEDIQRLNQTPTFQIPAELGLLLGQSGSLPPVSPAPVSGDATNAPRLPEPPQPLSGGGGQGTGGYRDDFTQEQYDAWVKRTYPSMPFTFRR
jgi:hypothetical protein